MVIKCPECKAILDIGASDPKKSLEVHFRNIHPDKLFTVKKEKGQSLKDLIQNVKSQIKINIPETNEEKNESEQPKSGDVQPVGSDASSDTEDKTGEAVPDKPKLSGEPKYKSKSFSRKRTNN